MAVIWWMRRDLRLSDNRALAAAMAEDEVVIPVFVADPTILKVHNMGAARLTFCFECVREVDERLREAKKGYVVVRYGDPLEELKKVARETKATAVFFNRDYSELAQKRDGRVVQGLKKEGIRCQDFKDLVVFEAGEISTTTGGPYKVYTPYLRRWQAMTPPPVVGPTYPDIPDLHMPEGIKSDDLPTPESLNLSPVPDKRQAVGEIEARKRMAEWFDLRRDDSIAHYREHRNQPPREEGTSRFSPHLRFGTLSPRTLYAAAMETKERTKDKEIHDSIDIWLSELAWRDFYYQILAENPEINRTSYVKKFAKLDWLSDKEGFEAWQSGTTGFPYIDAAMRQLAATGFMHNRARMAVANFLCKDLLVNWVAGYDHFMRLLTDGDPASNSGGWQWAASTGASSQPYFRVLHPITQGKKHDPQGVYVRRWVPELHNVPDEFIHEPWRMSQEQQETVGCIINKDYPAPLIDHDEQRDQMLKTYRKLGRRR